jgi:nicotinate phosphoribosyltransferase
MGIPTDLYRPSLALLTDLYQLTMAYAAWRSGVADREAVFHLFFRKNPFGGGYAVACGLAYVKDYLEHLRFDDEDIAYLREVTGPGGSRLFEEDFLVALRGMSFHLDVDAIPEGTVVFAQEPLVRVRGPIIPCMLAETPLLNMINFQTLIATKAARIVQATRGEPVLDFGLRRAQGIDGALTAARAAYIGGCSATSNAMAGRLFGIPVRGTHAHSWIMLFDDELEAFETYARALPQNCVFLVDTYDTLDGVRKAIKVGAWLRENGHELLGVRLDSGDLAYLSIEARKLLDQAGFPKAHIFATNDLDEHIIASLKEQGAAVAVWGVGTKLATAYDDPALGGVYKLAAVRRFRVDSELVADAIFDEERGWRSPGELSIVDPFDMTRRKRIPNGAAYVDLLVPVLRGGKSVYETPPIAMVREQALSQVAALPAGMKRLLNPQQYPVGLEPSLHDLKTRLVLEARGHVGDT